MAKTISPRASEPKGVLKAGKDLQEDPPTSWGAEITMELDPPCSHPEPFYRICMLCGESFPVIYGTTPEFMPQDDW